MTYIHECSLCGSHADQVYHSTYLGHPIEYGESWITGKRHYHSNSWASGTLAGIKARIREAEGLS